MILYHVTHGANAHLISVKGLSVAWATGEPYIWLCTRSVLDHYRDHVAKSHGWQVGDTVVFCLDVPASRVTRYRRGVWRSATDIPPHGMTLYVPTAHPLMVSAGVLGLRIQRRRISAANSRGYVLAEHITVPRGR